MARPPSTSTAQGGDVCYSVVPCLSARARGEVDGVGVRLCARGEAEDSLRWISIARCVLAPRETGAAHARGLWTTDRILGHVYQSE